MKKTRWLQVFIFGLALSLAACAGSELKADDPYRLQKISDMQLCAAFGEVEDKLWGEISRDQMEGELHRRDLFTKDEWILVRDNRIGKGMSVCGLIASWGAGRLFFDEGEGTGDKNIVKYSYPSCRICPRIEVVTVAGKVQSWTYPRNNATYPQKKKNFIGRTGIK